MSNYHGPAVLIFDDGSELSVTANTFSYTEGARPAWRGTLSVPDGEQSPKLVNLPQGVLRIGDLESPFVRPTTSDWTRSPAGQCQITILGSGDIPF